ncbi:hypothetical protein [Pseudomonas indica]|uniref:hypothetical protein n=1 Tax=Pseudomonas indica TaxID=137658 RepID=UPI003FD0FA6F
MNLYPLPVVNGVPRPKIYNWIGKSADILYWDDPNNWAEGEYPNHPEATAMFKDAIDRDVTILLRKDIQLANIWFSESTHSYTIDSEGNPENAKLTFMTGQQLANITLDDDNRATHTINAMILHSCKKLWGPGWRTVSPSAAPDPIPENVSKLRLGGKIANYKEAPRASLNIDGYIDVEISGSNEFIGPVVVNRGSLQVKSSESIPSGTSLLLYSPGKLIIDDGVVVNVKRLSINGNDLPNGTYGSDTVKTFTLVSDNQTSNTGLVQGAGKIVVSG